MSIRYFYILEATFPNIHIFFFFFFFLLSNFHIGPLYNTPCVKRF